MMRLFDLVSGHGCLFFLFLAFPIPDEHGKKIPPTRKRLELYYYNGQCRVEGVRNEASCQITHSMDRAPAYDIPGFASSCVSNDSPSGRSYANWSLEKRCAYRGCTSVFFCLTSTGLCYHSFSFKERCHGAEDEFPCHQVPMILWARFCSITLACSQIYSDMAMDTRLCANYSRNHRTWI